MGKINGQMPVASHSLQLRGIGKVRVLVFEHTPASHSLALLVGDPEMSYPLVRIHSSCLYGDVFSSLECDCREQLDAAMRRFREEKGGILIYLDQEGRGAGIFNKAKAYELTEKEGVDTVEAFRSLGFDEDLRSYDAAASVLKQLGISHVRLLTNNPAKVQGLRDAGITVEQEHLRIKPTSHNKKYLLAKQQKLGHSMGLNSSQV